MGVRPESITEWVRPSILDHRSIGMIWAILNGEVVENDAIERYREQIAWAVIEEQLKVRKISVKNKNTDNFEKQLISSIILEEALTDWQLDRHSVLFFIHRDDFLLWLQITEQWPLPEYCALLHWFDIVENPNAVFQSEYLTVEDNDSQDNKKPNEHELNQWLREIWITGGKLGGSAFFYALKKYKNQKGSPINEHYSAGKDAGIMWRTSSGCEGRNSKKTIQNKVSTFKKSP